jgi:hypothetical protein
MNPLHWTSRQLIGVRAILTFIVAFMAAPQVEAGSITSTWRAPTQYATDGTTITAPITYRMEYAPEGSELTPAQSIDSNTTTATAKDLAPGRWCNRIVSIVERIEAAASETVCVTVPPKEQPPPAPSKKPNPAFALRTTAAP